MIFCPFNAHFAHPYDPLIPLFRLHFYDGTKWKMGQWTMGYLGPSYSVNRDCIATKDPFILSFVI